MTRSINTVAALAAVALASTLAIAPAGAAEPSPAAAAAKSTYAKDRADCEAGRTAEDRATCLKEAGAAQDERKRNRLDNTGSVRQNAVDRCNALAGKNKTDCMARIEGSMSSNQQTTTSGSVAGGGILRETRTTTVGTPVVVVPATPAASAPR